MRRNVSAGGSGMGLLEGLSTLEGAPPPAASTPPNGASAHGDAMATFSNGAKSMFDGLGGFGASISGGAVGVGSQMRQMLGGDIEEGQVPAQQTFSEEMSQTCNLTWMQRISLFAMVFGAGVMMIIMSISFLPLIVIAPHKFAGSFTMGNILAILSTWLLVGPRAQLQTMFQPGRALAAGMYVGSLVFVLLSAFFGGALRPFLVLVGLVAEISSCKFTPHIACVLMSSMSDD